MSTPRFPTAEIRVCGLRSRAYKANCLLPPGHEGDCSTGTHTFVAHGRVPGGVKAGRQPDASVINGLTQRQRQVVWLIAHEVTSPGVASALGISLSTAKHHVDALFSLLDAKSKAGILFRVIVEKRMSLESLSSEVMP